RCQKLGVSLENDWPYAISKFSEQPPAKLDAKPQEHRISNYRVVPRNSGFAVHRPAAAHPCWTCAISVGLGVRPRPGLNCVAMITRRSLASMSANDGVVLVRYQGER